MQSEGDYSDWKNQSEDKMQLDFLKSNFPGGIIGGYIEEGLPYYNINDSMLKFLGYESREEFSDCIKGILLNCIYAEDRKKVIAKIFTKCKCEEKENFCNFRVLKKNGNFAWIVGKTKKFKAETGENIFITVCADITKYKQNGQDFMKVSMEESGEDYKIALSETNVGIWEYDIAKKILFRIQKRSEDKVFPDSLENVPMSIIESGLIHKDSEKSYLELYKKVLRGETRAVADIRWNLGNDYKCKWERIAFTAVFDEVGQPVRAIVVTRDITKQKEAEINYQMELQLRDYGAEEFVAGSRANLNENRVEFIQGKDGNPNKLFPGMTYDAMAEFGAIGIVNAEDKKRYFATLSKEALIKTFEEGKTIVSMDYRRKEINGKINWVKATAHLVKNATNGEIYSYSNIKNINEQKNLELALVHRAEYDGLTGAYNKETAFGMIRDAMIQAHSTEEDYAILLFRVDRFSYIIQNYGYECADRIICELYEVLQAEIHYGEIIGRIFKNEFVVWVGGSRERKSICADADKIRNIFQKTAMTATLELPVTLSVGIVYNGDEGRDEEELFRRATEVLMQCRNRGGDCCIVSEGNIDYSENFQPLSNELNGDINMAEILMDCTFSLNSVADFGKNINDVLHNLIKYYGGESGCFVEINRKDNKIKKVYNCSESNTIKDKPDNYFTDLLDILKQRKHVFISNIEGCNDEDLYCKICQLGVNGLYATALELNGCVLGYVSINNPTKNFEELVVLNIIASLLIHHIDKKQMKKDLEYKDSYDELTGLLNRSRYLSYVEGILPDAMISIGLLLADINGLKKINAQYGYEYGDKIISSVATAMKEEFSDEMVFRLEGDEFVAICESLTAEAFRKHVNNFKDYIDKTYPNCVAIGYVWTDTEIDMKKLGYQVDEKLMVAKRKYYTEDSTVNMIHNPYEEIKLINEIRQGHYHMYLQPKAKIENGVISGAEALVRYKDAKGMLIPPDKFVPQLEQNGNIHYIDIFMFEEVCSTLKRWQDSGVKLIPISLNFSRTTLLVENLIQKMEEIYIKYAVPKNFIEIEVTESIGSLERETLIQISCELVGNDYRLALDDFGAKYSNLSVLSSLKLHVLKLDKSLVHDLFSNLNTRIVVKNFLRTCRELYIESVAEGVETKEQLDALRVLGCDYAQGYYFNKPIPCIEFEKKYMYCD